MDEGWIVIPGWDRFQHYSDRDPLWIKNYLALLADEDYLALTPGERSLLHGIWLAYASAHGQLRLDARSLSARLRLRVTSLQLESLNHAGWIEVSASKPLSLARARALAREEKIRVEPPYPHRSGGTNSRTEGTNPRAVAKRDAPRRRAERWIDNGLAAEVPSEHLADVLADEFGIHDPELLDELVAYANGRVESIP